MAIFFCAADVNTRFVKNKRSLKKWILSSVNIEGYGLGDINYVFCSDNYLHQKNIRYLNHDTYTDIITFEYNVGKTIHADIFISTERILENAKTYGVSPQEELRRIMIHGILHLCGYKDKKKSDKKIMTQKEDLYLLNFKRLF